MPVIIAPSVAEADVLHLGTELESAVSGDAEWLHVRVQYGNSVLTMGIVLPIEAAVRMPFPSIFVSVELEVMDLEYRLSELIETGADIITFHADATNQLAEFVEVIRKADLIPGLLLNPHEPMSSLFLNRCGCHCDQDGDS